MRKTLGRRTGEAHFGSGMKLVTMLVSHRIDSSLTVVFGEKGESGVIASSRAKLSLLLRLSSVSSPCK